MLTGDGTILFILAVACDVVASAILFGYLTVATESDWSSLKGLIAVALGAIVCIASLSVLHLSRFWTISLVVTCASCFCLLPVSGFRRMGVRKGWEYPNGKKYNVKRTHAIAAVSIAICIAGFLFTTGVESLNPVSGNWRFYAFRFCVFTVIGWATVFLSTALLESAVQEVMHCCKSEARPVK